MLIIQSAVALVKADLPQIHKPNVGRYVHVLQFKIGVLYMQPESRLFQKDHHLSRSSDVVHCCTKSYNFKSEIDLKVIRGQRKWRHSTSSMLMICSNQ